MPSEPASQAGPNGTEALVAASRKARGEKTWIVTDGSVGMEAQGIAAAEAVGLSFSLFLALADAIVATEDLVNMVIEAAGTGKPVDVQRLSGSSRRLARFHALMQERGATRPSRASSRPGPMRPSTTQRWSPLPSDARSALIPKPKSPLARNETAACSSLPPLRGRDREKGRFDNDSSPVITSLSLHPPLRA